MHRLGHKSRHALEGAKQVKRLYHGTATTYLDSIMRNGLKPSPENRWRIKGTDLYDHDYSGGVYLTPDREYAEQFANLRAQYLQVLDGECVQFGGLRKLCKDSTVRDRNAKPVVLAVKLPESVPLEIDFDSSNGYWTPKTIAPQYVSIAEGWDSER